VAGVEYARRLALGFGSPKKRNNKNKVKKNNVFALTEMKPFFLTSATHFTNETKQQQQPRLNKAKPKSRVLVCSRDLLPSSSPLKHNFQALFKYLTFPAKKRKF
jgi:hypothetical protein